MRDEVGRLDDDVAAVVLRVGQLLGHVGHEAEQRILAWLQRRGIDRLRLVELADLGGRHVEIFDRRAVGLLPHELLEAV